LKHYTPESSKIEKSDIFARGRLRGDDRAPFFIYFRGRRRSFAS
jgi:hypothetical protein